MSSTVSYRFENPRKASFWQMIWIAGAVFVIFMGLLSALLRYQIELETTQTLFADALPRLGINPVFYAMFRVSMDIIMIVIFSSTGLFIFLRQRRNPMLLLVAMMLIFFGSANGMTYTTAYFPAPLNYVAAALRIMSRLALISFAFTFPDGRFVPSWSKYVLLGSFLLMTAAIIAEFNVGAVVTAFDTPVGAVVGLIVIWAQVYRARKVSSPKERQQNKWVLLGFIGLVIGMIIFTVIDFPITPWLQKNPDFRVLYRMIFTTVTLYVPVLLLPITIAFSVARNRLWDVDLTINRSIVYGIVTAILILVFGLVFWLAQSVLGNLLGANNAPMAGAIASVVLMLLFRPLRAAIQTLIDRRVYGFRFDLNQLERVHGSSDMAKRGLFTGKQFGSYQALEVLGRGGMGEVYKGHGNNQDVAIKILPEDLATEEAFRKRFEREAEVLQGLDHSGIVRVYEAGQQDRSYYIAMEYVEGEDLGAVIKRRGAIPLREIQPLVTDFAAALDYAHQAGFVHRDIKPSNIMLRQQDAHTKPVLMDFGLAKMKDMRTKITGSGAIGTIDYMAPEQIEESQAVDYRADIYALGVVLYELLTGEKPFSGNPAQILFAHLQQPPPDPRKKVPELPENAVYTVGRALSKDPEDRFKSAGDFAKALIS
jgi:predicted Ser/Thr protein kinase